MIVILVWVMIASNLGNGGGAVVVDNIATKADCTIIAEKVGGHCFLVNKVK